MARDITVLVIGGYTVSDFISVTGNVNPQAGGAQGFYSSLQVQLATHDRSYIINSATAILLDAVDFLIDSKSTSPSNWDQRIAPHLPVDLAVLAFDGAAMISFFQGVKQQGDDNGWSIRLLAEQLHANGANAVGLLASGIPLYTPAVVPDGGFDLASRRVGTIALGGLAANQWFFNLGDLRTSLQPTSTYYADTQSSTGENYVVNAAGASAASLEASSLIQTIPRRAMQPDQDGT